MEYLTVEQQVLIHDKCKEVHSETGLYISVEAQYNQTGLSKCFLYVGRPPDFKINKGAYLESFEAIWKALNVII